MLLPALVFPLPAGADTGPKPSVEIKCANLPGSEVYIDLLIDSPPVDDGFTFGKMRQGFEPDKYYDKDKLNKLRNYYEDGWRPALVTGTSAPLWGELRCKVLPDGGVGSRFDYFGVPDRFKIIMAADDGSLTVSNVIERKAINCVVNLDFSKRTAQGGGNYNIAVSENNPAVQTAKQFAFTLSSTFIIEGLLLLLFGFSFKLNWKPFIFVNLGTQLVLNLLVAYANFASGTALALLAYLVSEIVILIVETILFIFLLKQHSRWRRALYAVVANIASFIAGFLLLGHVAF